MKQRSRHALLVAAMWGAFVTAAQAEPHVVMISIDGLRPEVYRQPALLGIEVPNLLALGRNGISADRMIPVFPSVTYPAHTTLVTGTRPAEHRIVANFKEGMSWYLHARDIHSETLWQAARRAGLSTAIVTWPVSYGAEVDYLVPENLSFEVPNLPELIRKGSTPGLFEALEEKCGPVELSSFDALDAGKRLDPVTTCFAAEVIRAHQPNLLLVHFLDADHMQHYFGPNSQEAMRAFEQIDSSIGELMAATRAAGIAEETTFVIVGDHGFVPLHTHINVSAMLLASGFAELVDGKIRISPALSVSDFNGSAVYLRDPQDHETGARLEAALQAEIDRRYDGIVELIPASELERMGAFPEAAFALAAAPGFMLIATDMPRATLPSGTLKGMHGHRPELPEMATGFLASGPGIRKGIVIPLIRQVDVAPTVAELLGMQMDGALGLPLVGLFDGGDPGAGAGLDLPTDR
ncbi:MAG: alkaline phosphatase family protein [Deltaproteobacteria bacterium]|nr:alkaline phosphatase family protein [Deltaproteobacteria bacterium]MBW2359979.1 alkaline phosphatase family protein [Deltaproteobacteria bacterium]